MWEVSQLLICSQELGPAFVLQKLLVNHVELLARGDELAQIPRGIKRGFVVCEWLSVSLSSPASPTGANGQAIPAPAAFLPKLGSGKGEQVPVTDAQGLKTLQCRGDHHDPHLGHPSGCSGNLNSALALCLGIISVFGEHFSPTFGQEIRSIELKLQLWLSQNTNHEL